MSKGVGNEWNRDLIVISACDRKRHNQMSTWSQSGKGRKPGRRPAHQEWFSASYLKWPRDSAIHTHTHTHTMTGQPSGVIWGLVSLPRTLSRAPGSGSGPPITNLITEQAALPPEPQMSPFPFILTGSLFRKRPSAALAHFPSLYLSLSPFYSPAMIIVPYNARPRTCLECQCRLFPHSACWVYISDSSPRHINTGSKVLQCETSH